MEVKDNIIGKKSFELAIRIVNLYKHLTNNKKEFILSKQLMRSGTSVGANVREAKNAESTLDFIHKMSIAQKECDETIYWLELMFATEIISENEFKSIEKDAIEVIKILKSIIITSKKKHKKFNT